MMMKANRTRRGAVGVEYAVLLALTLGALVAGVSSLGTNASGQFSRAGPNPGTGGASSATAAVATGGGTTAEREKFKPLYDNFQGQDGNMSWNTSGRVSSGTGAMTLSGAYGRAV